ncbi:SDR family NAD(P)-dependent oxidoreductase [Dictyobacter aurantiacus]|uniref:Short-chain dehydrogenase n=1 Tax=Dictyobacter aurantiacus TaxID=1936993 RepID=A0A401ZFQ4_9CHLR|nr:SDR family oxidoreductase [Dictyobacter aurantiacus]GCE05692.1 short-chain dehydrogenase [Dictyobacter aurantiacus]
MRVLSGKVAVITGSSRGLGLGIAQAFVREGASVVLAARSQESVDEAIQTVQQFSGARVSGLATDVGDLEQVKALAEHAVATFGRIDIWINNAGMAGIYGPTASIPPNDFERVVQTNILGTYHGSIVAIQRFLAQGGRGKLINLMGRGDTGPVAFQNAYASSKTWVRSFTLALAKEYKNTSIKVHAFNPGLVDTHLLRHVDAIQGYEKKLSALSTIIRLWGNPPAVPAERVVWLASNATDKKTGLEVRVLGKKEQFAGLWRELQRRRKHQPASDTSIDVTTIEPYTP